MPLTPEQINIENFLAEFTWLNDPQPDGRKEINLELFLQIASLLKISQSLAKIARKQ